MKKAFSVSSKIILAVVIPLITVWLYVVFDRKYYLLLSLLVVVLSCFAFMLNFERKSNSAIMLSTLASVIALSVGSRCLFSIFPFFKPVSAIIIMGGMYFGAEFGFMAGAMSALISNFVFSQGPWTPFQMLGLGLCGFFAGILMKLLKKRKFLIYVYGAFAGILYSVISDISTVLWVSSEISFQKCIAVFIASLPFCAVYCVSNVIFLLLLEPTLGKTFKRLIKKYF